MHLPQSCYSNSLRTPDSLATHYFSGINADPEKWDDPQRCWELFHDLNMTRDKEKFGPWDIDLGNGHADGIYASADWMIPQAGGILELAPFGHKTWHAGASAYNGKEKCNDFMAGVELIAAPQAGAEYGFTENQYSSLAWLILHYNFMPRVTTHSAIRREYQQRHPESDVPDKPDPGPTFSWSRLNKYLSHDLDGG